jgi:hypothetical protein
VCNWADWNNFTSGFAGAVIGAILGFLGSVFLNCRTIRRNRREAARAVLAEMFTNADRALSADAASTFHFHEFLDRAWQTQLPLVAASLRWPNLKTLVIAYDSAARAYENAQEVPKLAEESKNEERKEQIRKNVDSWFLDVGDAWVKAMYTLKRAATGWRERRQIEADIQKIERRLKAKRP